MGNIEHEDEIDRLANDLAGEWRERAEKAEAEVTVWKTRLVEETARLRDINRGAVEAITEWLRGDEAEAISNQAIRDEIPPEDALAHAIDQRFGGQ